MTRFFFVVVIVLTSTSGYAEDRYQRDGQPRNSYERQQETHRNQGYDTYRNGPLGLEGPREDHSRGYRRSDASDLRRSYNDAGSSNKPASHFCRGTLKASNCE